MRDPFLELDVRFVDECDVGERLGEGGAGLGVVVGEEFLGHPCFADDEVGAERGEDVEDAGQSVHEGDVNGLDHRPEGEAAVGDDEGVGVADAAQQRVDLRVEDAGFEHGRFSFLSR